ncbi:translin-associated factor x-interacting protein 1 [Plakobranchus ocellatus]|uniref:Translin-associated factor x-interacting protein 1 n=1 Tax=Plakobranchus ocellatus TaxID=259542 RepID=A0AAV3Y9J5_9GAST|nr:translin-associated factor x-interacting protein 1 [Plakobranchus ocellatus]
MAEPKMVVARLPPLSGGKVATVSPRAIRQLEGLNGPTYRLNDKLHPLPPPIALKPYVDTKAGELDTWPAHASGQALSSTAAMLSKNKSLVLVNEEDQGKPQMVPRPRFLEQLEGFLKKELRALGVVDVQPSELRLQAHREVFEYLIEDFKTYKPLLSAIKNEYEMMLAHQRQQIRHLEPLKQMLVTVSEQCEQKIMSLREEERGEMTDLKKLNKDLHAKISDLVNEQQDLKEQVARLQTKLEEEYHKYRDECDARKLLVADINDLRYQQEDYMASRSGAQANQDTDEDPVILKMALQKSREGERLATQRLSEMVANYGDVIPRRDFETLEAKHKEIEEKNGAYEARLQKLQAEYNALEELQKQVVQKRDEFYIQLETLKRSSTPRPQWDKCADSIQGGIMRWKELSEGKRSNELVDVLLSEIQSGGFADTAGADYFDPQGTGPEVPVYLQHSEPVRNRRLSKRDTALLVRDIWRTKSAQDAERTDGTRQNMGEFLLEYLQSRFPLQQIVVEWAYNLHDACQRYSHDDIIGLFWKVLDGKADEEIFHSQLLTIHSLLTQMTKLDAEQGNVGTLAPSDFGKCLIDFFKLQESEGEADGGPEPQDGVASALSVARASSLVKAATLELEVGEDAPLDYKSLFTEDDEGKTGPFLDEVKKLMKDQKKAYWQDIVANLPGASSPVTVDDLMRAVSMADPEISHEKMQDYIAWAFSTTVDGLKDVDPQPYDSVVERLDEGNITRVGRKM